MQTKKPAIIVTPGEIIKDELAASGWTQKYLAEAMQVTPKLVSELIRGNRAIRSEIAQALARAFEIPADFWEALEANYRANLSDALENQTSPNLVKA